MTVFTKGGKVRDLPLPDPAFWNDLERLILDSQAEPGHYLLPRAGGQPIPGEPMGVHALHDWWYGCLERAGVVAEGATSGERMHKARHTAGQRVLDADRQPQGRPEAARTLVDLDDRRRLRGLGCRAARAVARGHV